MTRYIVKRQVRQVMVVQADSEEAAKQEAMLAPEDEWSELYWSGVTAEKVDDEELSETG